MKKVSSFNFYKTECPICGSLNEFKGVKPKAYVETGRDTDFCPVGRNWLDSKHQVKNPLLYFMATCKNCLFTHELNKEFIEWKNRLEFKSSTFGILKRKHLKELNQKNGIIKKMGKALKPSKDPFSSAIVKFLLGICDESLKPDPSSYNLARYYLRIGWIFREEKQKEKSFWLKENLTPQSLGETLKSLHLQHTDYLQKIQELKNLVNLELASCGSELKNKEVKSQYNLIIDQMVGELTSLKNFVDQLQSIYQVNQDKPLPGAGNNLLRFEDFLFSLKMDWAGVPLNEKEALELSVDNYKESLTQDLRGNQKIKVSYLIGELSRRIGDLNSAKEYFDLTIDTGEDFIQENKEDHLKTALPHKILEMAHQQKEIILKERRGFDEKT